MSEQSADQDQESEEQPDQPETERPEADQVADDQSDDQPDEHPNREAAKWRRQLRVAEAERDELADKVAALQRQAIDQRAELAGIKPALLWAAGTELSDLTDDDGAVDVDRVAQAITAVQKEFGLEPTLYVPSEGGNTQHAPPQRTMASVLQGK